jgi:hypothetical protein
MNRGEAVPRGRCRAERSDSIDRDLVAFQRKEDAMGAYPESVAIAFGFKFLHIALKVVAHQLEPIADVATDGFFQDPQLLACLFADEELCNKERGP